MATHRSPHTADRAHISIRWMRPGDLEAVVRLDAQVFGAARQAYFEQRLAALDAHDPAAHTIGLVAEDDGAIAGFVMGTLTSGEFGFSEVALLMDSIAVYPRRQRRGIGRQLAEALIAEGAARGARDVYTLVNAKSWDMLKFFDSAHFGLAQTMLLRRPIGESNGSEP